MSKDQNIWIVDDDHIAVAIVGHLVERYPGLHIQRSFCNAEEALEALSHTSEMPDLIMLDLNMPVKSGWDLLNEMEDVPAARSVRVAVFTSSIDDRDRKKSANYPSVIGHFVKPMTREMLRDIADRMAKK